jgi:hypothetical protein
MYVLVPLLAPLVLLGVMGLAWVEDHLLPPAALLPPALLPPTAPAESASDPSGHPAA